MSNGGRYRGWVMALALGCAGWAGASAAADGLYRSPFADAPPARVGLANRSTAESLLLFVLAPERKGATATRTPSLCWFMSAASSRPLEIVVQHLGADRPLLEQYREAAGAAGFHCLDLAVEGVTLEEGTEYVWSVALVLDPARRAGDLFSMGSIQYVPSRLPLQPSATAEEAIHDRLRNGYWYDAIAIMQRSLAEDQDAPGVRDLRQTILASEQLVVR